MFSPDDYWLILQYLQGVDVPELDSNTKAKADSEKAVSTQLFEKTLDQAVFNTADYQRLRSFLIDWYATLKTVSLTQKYASDPFSLPDTHVQELIQSFGYNYPVDILPFTTKVNFFLDLVNLYKIKGTPVSVLDVLAYYGLTDTELVEYDLMFNSKGDLVFRGKRAKPLPAGEPELPWSDIPFDTMIEGDPHWLLSRDDVITAHNLLSIHLPSRSPYFGLRPRYNLSDIMFVTELLARMVSDQYELWKTTGNPYETNPTFAHIYDAATDFYPLLKLNYEVGLLELYMSCIYVFNRRFGRSNIYPPTWQELL